jgi:hypothetical protein
MQQPAKMTFSYPMVLWATADCAHDEVNDQRQHTGARTQGEEKQVIPAATGRKERHAVGSERLSDREAGGRLAPRALLGGRAMPKQLMHAAQDERDNAGREYANDNSRAGAERR